MENIWEHGNPTTRIRIWDDLRSFGFVVIFCHHSCTHLRQVQRLVGGSSRFFPAGITWHGECAWAKHGRSFSKRHWAHRKELGRGQSVRPGTIPTDWMGFSSKYNWILGYFWISMKSIRGKKVGRPWSGSVRLDGAKSSPCRSLASSQQLPQFPSQPLSESYSWWLGIAGTWGDQGMYTLVVAWDTWCNTGWNKHFPVVSGGLCSKCKDAFACCHHHEPKMRSASPASADRPAAWQAARNSIERIQ